MNISNNVSSMLAHQTMLNNGANNVANVNSDGYVPKNTNISNDSGTVFATAKIADDNGSTKSQTDLTKEITDQIVVQNVSAINVNVIKTQDETLGSLLDIKT